MKGCMLFNIYEFILLFLPLCLLACGVWGLGLRRDSRFWWPPATCFMAGGIAFYRFVGCLHPFGLVGRLAIERTEISGRVRVPDGIDHGNLGL